jgi:hypothetical protein
MANKKEVKRQRRISCTKYQKIRIKKRLAELNKTSDKKITLNDFLVKQALKGNPTPLPEEITLEALNPEEQRELYDMSYELYKKLQMFNKDNYDPEEKDLGKIIYQLAIDEIIKLDKASEDNEVAKALSAVTEKD